MMSQQPLLNEIIWQVVSLIPEGKVATYGQIARLSGYPNHARFVGTTLKALPKDSTLPWHRVITAQGKLAFEEGTPAFQQQSARLIAEGIHFHKHTIKLSRYRWQP